MAAKKIDVVAELNAISESGYVSFDDLEVGKPYKVLKFGIYKSDKYKKAQKNVRVDIDIGYLILPERFNVLIDNLDGMLADNLHIIFQGRDKDGKRLKIQFETIETTED